MTRTPFASPITSSDVSPGAGVHGSNIVAQGTPADVMNNPKSLTGKYLTGELSVEILERKPPNHRRTIKVINARGNNRRTRLGGNSAGLFTCVTGGLRRRQVDAPDRHALQGDRPQTQQRQRGRRPDDRIEGLEHIDKIIDIDQSPIGRTRAQPRDLYRRLHADPRMVRRPAAEAKARGSSPAVSPLNVKGGRCRPARATASSRSRCTFCPTSTSPATSAKGKRYNRETLEVLFKGKSIADVLDMTVEEAADSSRRCLASAKL
jgi:excinuclease ABC subunit A